MTIVPDEGRTNMSASVSASKATVTSAEKAVSSDLNKAEHKVQFYREDRSLLEQVTRFIGTALVDGDAAIVIATPAHREALRAQLERRGFRLSRASAAGRYAAFDAAETLAQFMAGDMPDAERFEQTIDTLIRRARAALNGNRSSGVAVFGEMVALLWLDGKHEAALRLEELWNSLVKKHSFSLHCAYPLTAFNTDEHGELFLRICDQHSSVLPELAPGLLTTADEEGLRTIAQLQQKVLALERQKELHDSEERFRLLIEAVEDYAIFMLDQQGHVSSWNSGAERIKGYRAEEILGKHFSCFFTEQDLGAGKPERELEKARKEGRALDEGWRVRKDGSRFWANVVLTALKDQTGKVIGFAKVTRDFTERMEAQRLVEESRKRLEESEQSLRHLSLRLLRSQDEERRRIARDLHDSLGQYLSVLKMKLDSLNAGSTKKDPREAKELQQCVQLTEEAVKEVRTISYLLYPPMLEELGLKSAIPWYLDGFAKRSGIKTNFEISADFGRLPGDIELVLFRVLQESLTNVHRHSGSPTADVQLRMEGGDVVLMVKDQGKGLEAGNLEEAGRDWMGAAGVGLRGMTERVRHVGGRLEMFSTGEGTTVTAVIPVQRGRDGAA